MAIPLIINGQTFEYPVDFDENWGIDATGWAQAVTSGMLQRAGGSFPLTADVDFGSSFGLKAAYFESRLSNPAAAGLVRLAKTDVIDWRNNANSADNILAVNSIDQLEYNGVVVGAAGGVTSLNSLTGALNIVGTANQVIVTPSTPNITLSLPQNINSTASPTFATVTANLMGDVTGNLTGNVTGNVTGNLTGTVTGHSTLDLALTGGTMSGAIAMGSNKITGLTQGTATGDAISFPVDSAQIASSAIITSLIAANAVTQVVQASSSTIAAGTAVTGVNITTTGGPVLIFGSLTIVVQSTAGGAYNVSTMIWREPSSTSLTGAYATALLSGLGTTVNNAIPMTVIGYDTPAAGTYSYDLGYTVTSGVFQATTTFNIFAIELKR